MRTNALVDSSYLFALFTPTDENHLQARVYFEYVEHRYLVPQTALTEVEYLLRTRSGQKEVSNFLSSLVEGDFALLPIEVQDITRIQEIRQQYQGAKLDFVDCCLMALAERHAIHVIYTHDRRDFHIFRPRHVKNLEHLP